MNFENKYLKYKKKYINLKYFNYNGGTYQTRKLSEFKRKFNIDFDLNGENIILKQKSDINLFSSSNNVPRKFYLLFKDIKMYQLDVCIKNPDEVSFNLNNFSLLLFSMYNRDDDLKEIHSDIYQTQTYMNMFYLYPNLDNVYNTFLNNPLNSNYDNILQNPFSIRFDMRYGVMAVMTCYNMLVLDYDTKDFFDTVNYENNLKTKQFIKKSFIKLCTEAKKKYNLILVWCITQTDKGVHLYLVNHHIDSRNAFWARLLVILCCDINYAVFTRSQNFAIRLSKKSKREKDIVAIPMEDNKINLGEILITKSFSEFIYFDNSDLETIKPDLIKTLKYKFRLINYFQNFTEKHLEYIKWYKHDKEYINQIREDIITIWNSLPSLIIVKANINGFSLENRFFDLDIKYDSNILFTKINKIFQKNFRYKNTLIEVL